MGSIFSKKVVGNLPRDKARERAAAELIAPVKDKLKELEEDGSNLKVHFPSMNDGEESTTYHRLRERPFYFSDAEYPSCIIEVFSAEDVAKVVRVVGALDRSKYKFTIAAGCHSHICMKEQSIVMDIGALNDVSVDTENQVIRIGGGAKLENANKALKDTGFGFVTGTNGDTGVGGLTLAGGWGWLARKHGLACLTLVSAQVVLTDGKIVVATDSNEYSDLLRALRGGGGGFGVVTEFTLKLFPAKNVFAGETVFLAPTKASKKACVKAWYETLLQSPPDFSSIGVVPAGAPVFVAVVSAIDDKYKDAKTFKDIPAMKTMVNAVKAKSWVTIKNNIGRTDFYKLQAMLEPVQQRTFAMTMGVLVYDMNEKMIETIYHFTHVEQPNNKCVILLCGMGGVIPETQSPHVLSHIKAKFWMIIEGGYSPEDALDPAKVEKVKDWCRRLKAAIIELGGTDGVHEFADVDQVSSSAKPVVSEDVREFLVKMRKKYDSQQMLHFSKVAIENHGNAPTNEQQGADASEQQVQLQSQ